MHANITLTAPVRPGGSTEITGTCLRYKDLSVQHILSGYGFVAWIGRLASARETDMHMPLSGPPFRSGFSSRRRSRSAVEATRPARDNDQQRLERLRANHSHDSRQQRRICTALTAQTRRCCEDSSTRPAPRSAAGLPPRNERCGSGPADREHYDVTK